MEPCPPLKLGGISIVSYLISYHQAVFRLLLLTVCQLFNHHHSPSIKLTTCQIQSTPYCYFMCGVGENRTRVQIAINCYQQIIMASVGGIEPPSLHRQCNIVAVGPYARNQKSLRFLLLSGGITISRPHD